MTAPDDHDQGRSQDDDPTSPQPRVEPRPILRPEVDQESARAFGRPNGVQGSFTSPGEPAAGTAIPSAPPPPALVSAFGMPAGAVGGLQRPPVEGETGDDTGSGDFWGDGRARDPWRDPWRDPGAGAVLGAPALSEKPESSSGEPALGARLSLREVLFGRRLSLSALAVLGAVVLLVGAVGGLVGRLTAEGGNPLTDPDVTLSQVEPAVDRPAGSVAAVADRVLPSVVSIEVRVGDQGGFGSGVMIEGAGYVLTNNHVVAPAAGNQQATLEAVFADGTRVPARIVGRDPKTDLAVLKVDVANPAVAALGRSTALRPGDQVIAIGSPLGLASTITTGIVSAVDRPVRLEGEATDTNAVIDAIQTDAAINPGNSGGPLVDSSGAVVGINTAIRTLGAGGGGSIGLGFAIPIGDARDIAQELIRSGTVSHSDLGVNAASVTNGTSDGARVQNVQRGSAAAEAGIVEGDVIVRVGDRSVATADELVVAVREYDVGARVPIALVRETRPLTVSATLKSE
ncbi:MAG: trypsin-like serine protease [Pseudonocardiaceae bacterium]|nr:trypsin-like serine protease [Pseudonocardiaceae bacterium]